MKPTPHSELRVAMTDGGKDVPHDLVTQIKEADGSITMGNAVRIARVVEDLLLSKRQEWVKEFAEEVKAIVSDYKRGESDPIEGMISPEEIDDVLAHLKEQS